MLIVANWKSNKNLEESVGWLNNFAQDLDIDNQLKVVVCPQFSEIRILKEQILKNNYPILLGSQNISQFPSGAYTGEVFADSLKDIIYLSIIGHSERRKYFGENEEIINQKVQRALESNIIPLVCVQGSDAIIPEGCRLVAYEPTFAIGTDNPDTPENANNVALLLKKKYGEDLQVLYGGSVNSRNYLEFIKQENISGLLIGRASWDFVAFKEIVEGSIKVS